MANYTKINIYRKQMKQLNLNTQQYAKLIDMPYEVVKDIIYDKEGNYNMEIKNILRNTMFNKHQEIENDIENAKFRAREIRYNENDYMKWYKNEYTPELLLETLNLKTRTQFEKQYDIMIDEERASHWFYVCLTSKINYDNHEIRTEVVQEFAKQLYDILVNNNANAYRRNEELENVKSITTKSTSQNKKQLLKWYKSFDVKTFMKQNKLDNTALGKELKYSPAVVSRIINKRDYSKIAINKLYDLVKRYEKKEAIQNLNDIRKAMKNGNTKEIEDLTNKHYDIIEEQIEEDDNNATMKLIDNVIKEEDIEKLKEQPQVITMKQESEIINSNDIILRKLLADRLTEEEKELIRIFGGKIC